MRASTPDYLLFAVGKAKKGGGGGEHQGETKKTIGKEEGNRMTRKPKKKEQQRRTPSNQRGGQQPYGILKSRSNAAWSIHHLYPPPAHSSDDSSGAKTVAPVPSSKMNPNIKESKKAATEQMTTPSRRRGSTQTGFRMQVLSQRVASIAA